ncbi:uncharacterized protein LOC122245687, partial [Penaeus japonicus]|uniref:uncharacterized protein LOC122245687 n=1 Tax=Penaeus japonicus TaxID=27405 RepID=UPI001C7170E5
MGHEFNATSGICSSTSQCVSRRGRSLFPAVPTYSYLCEAQPNGFLCADCRTMILCVRGQAFARRCSKGRSCDIREDFGGGVCYPDKPRACTCEKPNVFHRDYYDVQKFFYCKDAGANPTYYRCPDGMVYDEGIAQCRNHFGLPVCTQPGTFANPNNCAEYYSCTALRHGWLQRVFLCKNGTLFSETNMRCEDPCTWQFTCQEEGRFSDPQDRRRYFECFKEMGQMKRVRQQCPAGYMWNPKEAARECVEDTGDISYDNFTTCIVEEVRCRGEDHITYPVTTIIPETTPTAEASTIPEDITEVEPTTVPSTNVCDREPCFIGVNCTPNAISPFYTCGPCPAGYSGDGVLCEDLE